LPDAPAGENQRLHRLLRRHRTRAERRQTVPPDNPLLPNYKYVPIGYHGRASTIRPSGTDVRRPKGQTLPAGGRADLRPVRAPGLRAGAGHLDRPGQCHGRPIAIGDAAEHIAGFCLLNDWSARDIQAWEYQPLGPFLSKSFITSVSPWVVTAEALEPFRRPNRRARKAIRSRCRTCWTTRSGRGRVRYRTGSAAATAHARAEPAGPSPDPEQHPHMYWTVAQMVAHHSVNGCQLQAGDLFGSGTLSGPQPAVRQPAGDHRGR
jgi:fumarylacetoacetase